jgi:MarR family transcriptional regulator, organic hydroperoxide resistance regulator
LSDLRGLFNDLIRFEIELWNAIDARLKSEFGLPLTHFEPMSVIDTVPGCRVYDIANELGITTGGTSKLVDRIEASGYCRRLPNPDDRRSSLLELTGACSPRPERRSTTSCSTALAPRCRSAPCGNSHRR